MKKNYASSVKLGSLLVVKIFSYHLPVFYYYKLQPLRCKTAKHVMRAKNILPENHAAKALENLIIIRESHEHPSYKFQKLLPQSEYLSQFRKFFNECFRLF